MRGWGRLQLYCQEGNKNLPEHKVTDHEGNCWQPCPYSTQTTDARTRSLLGLADGDPLPAKNDHTDANGMVHNMKTQVRGSRWGYECTFDNCGYFIDNGERYFYV